MNIKKETATLVGNVKSAIKKWLYTKIDALAEERPRIKATSVYLKRGIENWMTREEKRINSAVDGISLFVADKDGNIDTDTLIDDIVSMFNEMEVSSAQVGMFDIEYGKGSVTINIPNNIMLNILFGDLGQVKITTEDLLEIKGML